MAMVQVNGYTLSDTKACSTRQGEIIDGLLNQLAEMDAEISAEWREALREMYLGKNFSQVKASETMAEIKETVRNYRAANWNAAKELAAQQEQARPEVPAGRYAVDTNEGHTGFYRVGVAKSGRITLFVYASDAQHEVKPWSTVVAILRKIEAAGLAAAQLRFGQEFEHCYRCGRGLTDEVSRQAGMGPDCRKK